MAVIGKELLLRDDCSTVFETYFFYLTSVTYLGPVVQSNVSLTSLLMLTVVVSMISNSQVFLLKKCE